MGNSEITAPDLVMRVEMTHTRAENREGASLGRQGAEVSRGVDASR